MGRQLCVRGCGFTRGRGAASDRRGRGACDKCEWWQREGAGKCARESWCALRLGGTRVCVATVVGVPAGDRVRSGRRVKGGGNSPSASSDGGRSEGALEAVTSESDA